MRVENNNKAFAYRIYSLFTQQCSIVETGQQNLDLAKYHNRHSSKSKRVTKTSFAQMMYSLGDHFGDSLVTFILFELCLLS